MIRGHVFGSDDPTIEENTMEAVQALSDYELERGKPMPSTNHAFVQVPMIGVLLHYAGEFSILSELSSH